MPRRKTPRRSSKPRRRSTRGRRRKSTRGRRRSSLKFTRHKGGPKCPPGIPRPLRKSTRRKGSNQCDECKRLLGIKIGINMKERRYSSRRQAIAVAYSQVRAMRPQCKRCFRRP